MVEIQNLAYRPVFFMIKKYRKIIKEKGWKGLKQEAGWGVVIILFTFFLVKGLIWLAIFYGLVNLGSK